MSKRKHVVPAFADDGNLDTFDRMIDGLNRTNSIDWEMSFSDFNSLYNMKLFFSNVGFLLDQYVADENKAACEKFLDTSYVNDDYFERILTYLSKAENLSDSSYKKLADLALKKSYYEFTKLLSNKSVNDDLKIWFCNEYVKQHNEDIGFLLGLISSYSPISEKLGEFIIKKDYYTCEDLFRRPDISDELKTKFLEVFEKTNYSDLTDKDKMNKIKLFKLYWRNSKRVKIRRQS